MVLSMPEKLPQSTVKKQIILTGTSLKIWGRGLDAVASPYMLAFGGMFS
jgi:hypothetical protein